jgi:hypothetical protein
MGGIGFERRRNCTHVVRWFDNATHRAAGEAKGEMNHKEMQLLKSAMKDLEECEQQRRALRDKIGYFSFSRLSMAISTLKRLERGKLSHGAKGFPKQEEKP